MAMSMLGDWSAMMSKQRPGETCVSLRQFRSDSDCGLADASVAAFMVASIHSLFSCAAAGHGLCLVFHKDPAIVGGPSCGTLNPSHPRMSFPRPTSGKGKSATNVFSISSISAEKLCSTFFYR